MSIWLLRCLICGRVETHLVAIQEHVMYAHGYTNEDLRRAAQREIPSRSLIFTMPDGCDWLLARRTLE